MSQGELCPGRWRRGKFFPMNRRRYYNSAARGSSNSNYSDRPHIRDYRKQRGGRDQRSHFSPHNHNHNGLITTDSHQREDIRCRLVRGEEENSSDEEAKSEKQKTANILRTRLLSLSDEYKSNSIRQLIEDTTETESLALAAKPTESEKQARRIAHVPKPIKASQPSSTPSPPTELRNVSRDPSSPCTAVQIGKTPKEQFMQNLMQDLIAKSPEDLKRMATDPRSSENKIFRHLTAIHSSQMSEAMRKLAEHKLQNDSSPLLLVELEDLVQADTVTDMCNMSLETLQCLQELFDLHCTYDSQPEAAAPILPKTEASVESWVDVMMNGNSFQVEERTVPPRHEMGGATHISLLPDEPFNGASSRGSTLHKLEAPTEISHLRVAPFHGSALHELEATTQTSPKPGHFKSLSSSPTFSNKKKKKKNSFRKTEKLSPTETHHTTDAKVSKEKSSQAEKELDSCNGNRPEQLLTDLQNLLGIMSSCLDEDSRILQSAAVSCIGGLIQNFTKQFIALNSRKSATPAEKSDAFLDPGGTIKRIKITAPFQSGLELPVTAKRPLEVIIDDHTMSPPHQETLQLCDFFVSRNGNKTNFQPKKGRKIR